MSEIRPLLLRRYAAILITVLGGILGCTVQADGPRPQADMEACRVTRIVDGDSIECDPVGRIRLLGIDAPELGQPPFGARSLEALERMMPEGSQVWLEEDVEQRDTFGRALRYVWAGDQMVNWAMVRDGYAVLLTYPPNVRHVEALQNAQQAAQSEGSGLWATSGFECMPRDFRRNACQ